MALSHAGGTTTGITLAQETGLGMITGPQRTPRHKPPPWGQGGPRRPSVQAQTIHAPCWTTEPSSVGGTIRTLKPVAATGTMWIERPHRQTPSGLGGRPWPSRLVAGTPVLCSTTGPSPVGEEQLRPIGGWDSHQQGLTHPDPIVGNGKIRSLNLCRGFSHMCCAG